MCRCGANATSYDNISARRTVPEPIFTVSDRLSSTWSLPTAVSLEISRTDGDQKWRSYNDSSRIAFNENRLFNVDIKLHSEASSPEQIPMSTRHSMP